MKNLISLAALAATLCMMNSCTNGPKKGGIELQQQILGRYYSQGENEFDLMRDTLEIRSNDQGKFDVIQTSWSSAKKDDPLRPINKVAGQWNNNSGTKILVAEFQKSDTSLRITEEITGRLNIISFDIDHGTLINRSLKGEEKVYQKIKD